MKPQIQKQISVEEINAALVAQPLAAARAQFADYRDARMKVTGTVLKVVKTKQRLHLKLDSPQPFEAFANFTESEWQKVIGKKIRKSSQVSLTGKFQTFGTHAVTISGCKLQSI